MMTSEDAPQGSDRPAPSTYRACLAADEPFAQYARLTAVVLALATVTGIGCGKGDRLPTFPVQGTVMLPDGQSLPGGTIIFESIEHGLGARGVIELDGTFRVGTYEEDDGAVAGEHRVAIIPDPPMNVDPDEAKAPVLIHARYSDLDESGLRYAVNEEAINDFEITVQTP